jgi:hypothetical protein
MSSTIQISSISGTPPFNVYVFDFYGNNEVFLSTINDNVPPVVYFTLPSGFTNVPMVKVKIVDISGCTISYDEICGPIPSQTTTPTNTPTPTVTPTITNTPTPTVTPTITESPTPTPTPFCFSYTLSTGAELVLDYSYTDCNGNSILDGLDSSSSPRDICAIYDSVSADPGITVVLNGLCP